MLYICYIYATCTYIYRAPPQSTLRNIFERLISYIHVHTHTYIYICRVLKVRASMSAPLRLPPLVNTLPPLPCLTAISRLPVFELIEIYIEHLAIFRAFEHHVCSTLQQLVLHDSPQSLGPSMLTCVCDICDICIHSYACCDFFIRA